MATTLRYQLLTTLFFLLTISLPAQDQLPTIFAPEANQPITPDGKLEEAAWKQAKPVSNFQMNFPVDTALASNQTKVWMLYDDNFIYIGGECYSNSNGKYIISSLRRDYGWGQNENFTVYIDPFQDQTNGFTFNLTPFGVQREGLIFNGDNVDTSWDNRWQSGVTRQEGKWVFEMKIPFKTLRYKGGVKKWRINFARNDLQHNERSTWIPVPINFRVSALAFTGILAFEKPLKTPGLNIAVIPYISGQTSRQHAEGLDADYSANAGFDAKLAVTPSLNLDLTVNPDFSQVEVDQQVTNLSRFEIFFPERRQFFIENSDLFAQFGFRNIRPFFSRRIGIGQDTTTETIVQNPILYGARLSGKVDKNWRVGLLNMQTAKDEEKGINAQNFTVAAFQRQVFSRSNIAGIFINRQTLEVQDSSRYTRIVGVDYNIQSKDNKWVGKVFYHRAFKPNQTDESFATAGFLGYRVRKFALFWNHEYIGRNYDVNDIGFVRRQGVWRFEPFGEYIMYGDNNSPIARHGPSVYLNIYKDLDFNDIDRNLQLTYQFEFKNTVRVEGGWRRDFVKLVDGGFDPTGTEGKELEENSTYNYGSFFAFFSSDRRKAFNFNVNTSYGDYFIGTRFQLGGGLTYRFQPYGSIQLTADYNDIQMPETYNDAQLLLLGVRTDISFTKSLFLSTFLQYNEQADNVNINARLQWRFKPVSDIFLVYTDNYFPNTFEVKSRALVFKMSYWLNL